MKFRVLTCSGVVIFGRRVLTSWEQAHVHSHCILPHCLTAAPGGLLAQRDPLLSGKVDGLCTVEPLVKPRVVGSRIQYNELPWVVLYLHVSAKVASL